MTDENKFFRYLWRFNAILIAGAGILLAGSVAFFWLLGFFQRTDNFVPQKQKADPQFHYSLAEGGIAGVPPDRAKLLEGSHESYLVLSRVSKIRADAGSYDSGRGYSTWPVNLLILDIATGKERWIFKGVEQKLESVLDVRVQPSSSAPPGPNPVKALLLTVTDADTNKDGALTDLDRKSLYLYRPGDLRAVKFLEADEFVSMTQTDAENVLIVYRDGDATRDAILSTANFAIHIQGTLPTNPQ